MWVANSITAKLRQPGFFRLINGMFIIAKFGGGGGRGVLYICLDFSFENNSKLSE